MATKPRRCIVCEGKDDLAAFRGLLIAEEARKLVKPGLRAEHYETDRAEISLEARDGKSMLVELALAAATGTAGVRPDMLLVSFDPDLDAPAREFAFFEQEVERRKNGRLTRDDDDRRVLRISNRDVVVLPAPWRSARPCFAGLAEEHCMERVLIDGILEGRPQGDPVTRWAVNATVELAKLVSKHGHKRAFRLWSAALDPSAESFVARLFQMAETRSACLAAVRATPAWKAFRALLDT